jgi:hypothetical protein
MPSAIMQSVFRLSVMPSDVLPKVHLLVFLQLLLLSKAFQRSYTIKLITAAINLVR